MSKSLLVLAATLLLSFANAKLYAQDCGKCCGYTHLEDTAHRGCDGWKLCHVTQCDTSVPSECCWSIGDHYNDVCTDPEATEYGLHNCWES